MYKHRTGALPLKQQASISWLSPAAVYAVRNERASTSIDSGLTSWPYTVAGSLPCRRICLTFLPRTVRRRPSNVIRSAMFSSSQLGAISGAATLSVTGVDRERCATVESRYGEVLFYCGLSRGETGPVARSIQKKY